MRTLLRLFFWALLIGVLDLLFPAALLFRPAVGASMAALLLYGRSAWPAVFAGGLVGPLWLEAGCSRALIQSVCDTLQALWGVWLVRRHLGYPGTLTNTPSLIRFHLLVGPLACLPGSLLKTLGFVGLTRALAYPPLPFFLLDWIGQVLGCLMTVSTFLSVFSDDPVWKRRRASVAVPTLVWVLVSIYGRLQVQNQVDRLEHAHLNHEAQALAQDLQARLDQATTLLYSLSASSDFRPRLSALVLPGRLPRPQLLVIVEANDTLRWFGNCAPSQELRQALRRATPSREPLASFLEGSLLLVAPEPASGRMIAGVFDSDDVVRPTAGASRRDSGTRFLVRLGQRELLEIQPARALKPPLIHEHVDLQSGFRIEVSRRFDTNRPRIGLPVAFTVYTFLLLYLLRMSNQAVRLEEAMLAARQANQAKSLFLANMSHEIRTPMNGMLGLTRLVLQSGLAPAQAEQLKHVERSGQALLALLNDLLEVSRMEAGGGTLQPTWQRLESLLEPIVRSLSLEAEKKGLELLVRFDAGVPEAILVDRNRLSQVLLNLLGNAIKFTSSGEVELAVRLEQWNSDSARLRLSVRDTGAGIPAERLADIFEPFVQAETFATSANRGVGLGLAISRRLVELLGGQLEVESCPGEGSTFYFEIFGPARPANSDPFPAYVNPDEIRFWASLAHPTGGRDLSDRLLRWGFAGAASAREAELLLVDESSLGELEERHGPALALLPLSQFGDWFARCRAAGAVPLLRPVFPGELREGIVEAFAAAPADAGEPEVPAPVPAQDYPGRRALVADDHATNRLLATLLLERMGFAVDSVADGEQAVAAARSVDYDLILMDIRMPVLDGYAASLAIRAAGRKGPIVACTAHSDQELSRRPWASGMNEVLHKPIREERLREAVVAVLASDREKEAMHLALLASVGGNPRSAGAVAAAFLEELVELVGGMDEEKLRPDLLHRLKGSLEVFGDSPLLELCCESPEVVSPAALKTAAARLERMLREFLLEVKDVF